MSVTRATWRLLRTDAQTPLQLESAIHVVLVGLMLVLVSSAGNTRWINIPIGRDLRWPLLGALCGLALTYSITRRRPLRQLATALAVIAPFCLVALSSTAWSDYPRVTFVHAVTIIALLATAAGIALGTAGLTESTRQLLLAVLAGTVAVALAGLVVLALHPHRAVVPATTTSPARYQGLGANPDTVSLVLALGVPLAVWLAVLAGRAARIAGLVAVVLLDASIAASGSRGALVGAAAGTVVVAAFLPGLTRRARSFVFLAALIVAVADVAALEIPHVAKHNPPPPPGLVQPARLGSHDAEFLLPLSDEIGYPGSKPARPRTLFTSSGRLRAWRGALGQVAQRPLTGYGFGAEDRVFVDRYYGFVSSLPENAYLGLLLQIGAVGLATFAVLLAALLWPLRRIPALPAPTRAVAVAAAGVTCAGLLEAVTQSYLFAPGSVAAAPFWIVAFTGAATAAGPVWRSRTAAAGGDGGRLRAGRRARPAAGRVVRRRGKSHIAYPERIVPAETPPGIVALHLKRYDFARARCEGLTVLDAGCGVGYGSAFLAERAARVSGVDRSAEAIRYARTHYAAGNVDFVEADLASVPFSDRSFDAVCAFETIEHLDDQPAFLRECVRLLRPDGTLYVSTPSVGSTTEEPDNPFHRRELSASDLERLLGDFFRSVELWGQRRLQTRRHRAAQRLDVLGLRRRLPVVRPVSRLLGTAATAEVGLDGIVIERGALAGATEVIAVCTSPRGR